MKSFKVEVFVQGSWTSNSLRFATQDESNAYARDLMSRWTLVDTYRSVESEDPVNYRYLDGTLISLASKA